MAVRGSEGPRAEGFQMVQLEIRLQDPLQAERGQGTMHTAGAWLRRGLLPVYSFDGCPRRGPSGLGA